MKIGKYSQANIRHMASKFEVNVEYFTPMYNYLIYGLGPGSFFTYLLANDFVNAISRSHPGNDITNLKSLVSWIQSLNGYGVFWGNIDVVEKWLNLSESQRRENLTELNILYPSQIEMMMTLTNQPISSCYLDWALDY